MISSKIFWEFFLSLNNLRFSEVLIQDNFIPLIKNERENSRSNKFFPPDLSKISHPNEFFPSMQLSFHNDNE